MKNFPIHHNEQGSAILIVLGILTLVLVLALVFVGTSRNARTVALASADNTKAGLLAESAAARVESIIYYLQEDSLDFIPQTYAPNSGLEYHWAPYAGTFQIDNNLTEFSNNPSGSDITHLPVKIQHFRGYESTQAENKIKNQFLFYTHDSYNKLDPAHRPYELLAATNYGNYLNSSTSNFSGNFNRSSNPAATNFTYRNILDSNGIVLGRYAFMLLPEGTKFNVNHMAMAKEGANDNYVPSVDTGVISPNASDPGTQFDQKKKSTFAISGYEYDSDGKISGLANSGKYIEADTLQYGLHPQELRVSEDVIELADNLKLNNKNYPPQWFNYDNLLAVNDTLWTSGDAPLRDFYSLYTLYSGLDDREVVFHGREDETIDDCSTDSPKINLAYPGNPNDTDARKTWDELSVELGSDPEYLQSNFENILGKALYTDAGNTTTLFKDDSDGDVTPAVLANLVDFCDEDDKLSYQATFGTASNRLTYDSHIGYYDDLQVKFAGNEKVPAIIGVAVEPYEINRYAQNDTITGPGNGNQIIPGSWSVHGNKLKIRVGLVLQNYFNEEVVMPNKIKVVVHGAINPFFAGRYYSAGTNGNYNYILFGSSYNGGSTIDNGCSLDDGYDDIGETDSSLNVLRGNALVQEFEISATNCTYPTNNKLDARQVWHAMVTFEEDLPTFTTGYGNVEVCGLYWDIKDIIVMAADSDGNLVDLAHIEGNDDTCYLYETDTLTSSTVSFQTNLLNVDGWPLVWAVAKDPRVNHANTDWVWSKNYPTLGSSDLKPTGVETGVENHFGNWDGYNTNLNLGFVKSVSANMSKNLRAYALANIQYVCKNLTLSNAKDLEPNLNLKLVSGSDKTTNTFSTAFIPNHPFTSLWQLGAVSRGVPGQTVNLKKYGGPEGGLKYEDGDAWLLDYFKLNEVSPDQPFPGKFNPNCFNALSYRYLLANIPVNVGLVPADPTSPVDEDNPDPAWVYQPGRLDIDDVARTKFHYDWIDTAPEDTQVIDLENQLFIFTEDLDFEQHPNDEYIAPKQAEKQSWSPVEAFFNFVQIRNTPTYRVATVQADGTLSGWGAQQRANDRLAESLIGCSAGLLSTRYEYFTVFAIGQSLKYIGQTHTNSRDDYLPLVPVKPEVTYVSGTHPGKDFYNQLVNPVKIKVSDTEEGWYSILATQLRLMTIERDCWFNTMKVVRTQLY